MQHLALPVRDQERSRRFYEKYFGFDAGPATQHEDGVLIIRNADGFSLALGPPRGPWTIPAWFHFGFSRDGPDEVRAFRDRLVADSVPIVEEWDEPEYVSVKCLDPDGYIVEVAWDVQSSSSR
jgi:catechol 2,3-dioxygenase-like lactoylglutathione lyase family enzyme